MSGGGEPGDTGAERSAASGPDGGDLTREEMVREFGEPGVANPRVVDLITAGHDGSVHLVMIETRPWGSLLQLRQLEEKINRYLGYVLDGYFAEQYPAYRDRAVVLRLDCVREPPAGEAADFLEAAAKAVREAGLAFEVRVGGAPGAP